MDYPDDYQEEYTDEEELRDKQLEQLDSLEPSTAMDYPQAKKPESLFSLFKNVWSASDSTKVANLSTEELGSLNIAVRDCQDIALCSEIFHHPILSDYFMSLGEVTLATSMSKKGFFVELFVTSKKQAFKESGNRNLMVGQKKSKWNWFGTETQPQA